MKIVLALAEDEIPKAPTFTLKLLPIPMLGVSRVSLTQGEEGAGEEGNSRGGGGDSRFLRTLSSLDFTIFNKERSRNLVDITLSDVLYKVRGLDRNSTFGFFHFLPTNSVGPQLSL